MTEKWAYTVKYNPNDLTEDEYQMKINELLDMWRKNGVIVDMLHFENQDKRGQPTKMHAHGVILTPRGLYRKKLCKANFHIKLVAYKTKGWDEYTKKNIRVKIFKKPVTDRQIEQDISDEEHETQNQVIPTRSLFKRTVKIDGI